MLKISGLYFLSHHYIPCGSGMMSRGKSPACNDVPAMHCWVKWYFGFIVFESWFCFDLHKSTIFLRTVISQDFSSYFSIVNLSFWRKSTIFLRTSSKFCYCLYVMSSQLWRARLANEMMALLKIQVKFLNHICKNFVNIVDDNEFKRFD